MNQRMSLAIRGLVAWVAVVTAAGVTIAGAAGVFSGSATITCLLPAAAGPVKPDTPVRYQGVTVGTVSSVDADFDGATLTVRMKDTKLDVIPAGVRARLLPRTIFGDEYVALAVPPGVRGGGALYSGAVVRANTSTRTVRLYTAYNRLYELITAMRPAELQVALGTLADILRGRGTEIGKMIDKAAQLGAEVRPMLDDLGADLRAVAELGRELAAAAPDLLAALQDAVALSDAIVAERDALHSLLTSGGALAGQAQRTLLTNGERVIHLVHATDDITEVLGKYPNALPESLEAAERFLDAANRAFSTGRFKINAALTLDNPYPYTAEDCPRYPGMAGPNCGDPAPSRTPPPEPDKQVAAPGGTAGPVGSAQEDQTLRELAPLLPNAAKQPPPDVDVLGLLLGPLVRGQRVMVP